MKYTLWLIFVDNQTLLFLDKILLFVEIGIIEEQTQLMDVLVILYLQIMLLSEN